ncbi:MAG: heavy-metal-associated domain-containing protein [Methanosarcinaceae archaeon]|nr:heavy-metal-associated domain-containing protein [Methanosarcinaceae archaeon]
MAEVSLKIEGMMCEHCRATVDKAIRSVKGVQEVSVDLQEEQARVVYDPGSTDLDTIISAVAEAGYKVIDQA